MLTMLSYYFTSVDFKSEILAQFLRIPGEERIKLKESVQANDQCTHCRFFE